MRKPMKLSRKLWIYFGGFAIFILGLLWIIQIIFLNSFYETMKVVEIKNTGADIVREYNTGRLELLDMVVKAHFENGLSVGVYDAYGKPIIGADSPGSAGYTHQLLPEVVEKLAFSGQASVSFVSKDSSNRYNSAVFGAILKGSSVGTLYLCLSSPLEPMGATTQVLKTQLLIVTIISLIIAFILSFFISRKLSKPISDITMSATGFIKGNYDVTFKGANYEEINQLSSVLNHAAYELKKTDILRRDLMANVTHDLKTPLTIIRSYAEMIHDISGDNPEKRSEHAHVIMEEADRLSLLVTDILDLSRMESGVISLNKQPFNITESINRALTSFSVFAEKNGYTFDISCNESYNVLGDEARIQQVIYNLIGNAINYTGEDKKVKIVAEKSGEFVRVCISDTGKGIPAEEHPYVWNRYYKSSVSHHRLQNGTGVGLAIVKNIFELHGINYGIISETGCGSTFWFELPLI